MPDDATDLLNAIAAGDQSASEALLPLVYDELRRLASYKLGGEKKQQTLQATALVHEAYIRLVNAESRQSWDSKAHFFAAAAECMRRILIDNARRKRSLKRGGEFQRDAIDVDEISIAEVRTDVDILALNEALDKLEQEDEQLSTIVKLRCFVGMTIAEVAEATGVPHRSVDRLWSFAKAWLRRELSK